MMPKGSYGSYVVNPRTFNSDLMVQVDKKRQENRTILKELAKNIDIPYSWLLFEFYGGHKKPWNPEILTKIENYLKNSS